MIKDLISFCPDINLLRDELKERGFINEQGDPEFPLVNRTPTFNRDTPKTVTLIRCLNELDEILLRSFSTIEVLGTKEEVDADEEKTKKYESAYDRTERIDFDPDTGEEITVTPPYWHGGFA